MITADGVTRSLRYAIAPAADDPLTPFPETPRAYYELAAKLRDGTDGAADVRAAADYYLKAADQGHLLAQMQLASLYEKGLGVEKNPVLALAWYHRAAEQDYAPAETAIGYFQAHGLAGAPDAASAVTWYLKAASRGHAVAQHNLGHMYEEGQGVEADREAALLWYRAAAAQDHSQAAADVHRLTGAPSGSATNHER